MQLLIGRVVLLAMQRGEFNEISLYYFLDNGLTNINDRKLFDLD